MARWITGMGAATLLVTILLAGCGGASAEGPRGTGEEALVLAPEDVAVVRAGLVEAGVAVSGSLDPYRTLQVRAQLPGTVASVAVEQGEEVSAGQVLGYYETATLESRLAGAVSALAAAEAARASGDHALASAERLASAGAVSEQDLHQARSAAEAARAQVAAAEARLREARESLDRAILRAPADGVVSRRAVNPGEAVSPGQPLFTVVDVDTLELAGKVAADELRHVRVGGSVVFRVDAYPDTRFQGRVARIEPVADPGTRQVTVYVRLPNAERQLVGGLYATGLVVTHRMDSVLTAPLDALREERGRSYVMAVEGERLVRREVATGPTDHEGLRVTVTGGLERGAVILVGPAQADMEGRAVRVATPPSQGMEGPGGRS